MAKDALYAQPHDRIVDFIFDDQVAAVFADMVSRSVPGYATVCAMIGVLAGEYAQPDSRCYDLGCSLGGATLALRRCITRNNVRIIAIDNAPSMIERCRDLIARDNSTIPVELLCADIREASIEQASVVTLNFTLQFIAPDQRLQLLRRIHAGLLPGGVLILSEKIAFADDERAALHDALHRAFKRANRYSDLEISQKRAALENVLIADTLDEHRERLQAAGFSRVEPWFQCLNFISLIAVK